MKKLIVPIAAFGLMTGAAFAQDSANNFAALDTDLNGELSFAEVTVGWPDLTQANFDAADADMSGGLSVDELSTIFGATTLPAPADGSIEIMPMEPAPAPEPAPESDDGPPRSLLQDDD